MTVKELAARGLRVKPLVWEKNPKWPNTEWGGDYQLSEDDPGRWILYKPDGDTEAFETSGPAKAAAEAHHAARIAALIEVKP